MMRFLRSTAFLFLVSVAGAERIQEHGTLAQEHDLQDEEQSNKPPVQITVNWVRPLDVTRAFETMWKSMPVNLYSEFKISGYLLDMRKELMKRPDLPAVCPSDYVGKPVYLVVQKVAKSGLEVYKRAVVGGFFNFAGLGSLAIRAAHQFANPAAVASITDLVSTVAQVYSNNLNGVAKLASANPTGITADAGINRVLGGGSLKRTKVDAAINELMTSMDESRYKTLNLWWKRLTGSRNSAFLTLKDPERKNYGGLTVKLKCEYAALPAATPGTEEWQHLVVFEDSDGKPVPITAKHLALMIISLG